MNACRLLIVALRPPVHSLFGAAALAAGAAPALAAPMSTEEALSRVRAALGTQALAALPTGIEVRGQAKFLGVEGPFTLIFDGEGRFVSDVQGTLGQRVGFDGQVAWEEDRSAGPHTLDLADRDDALLAAWFGNGFWASSACPLRFSVEGEGSDDGEVALAFTVDPGHAAGVITIDRATWLPRLFKWEIGANTQLLSTSDFIDVLGVKVPRSLTQTSGMGDGMDVKVEAWGAPTFVRSPYAPDLGRPAGGVFDSEAPAALEVRRAATGHLMVHPLINGEDVGWFIFDTGAGANLMSPAAADRLGLEKLGEIEVTGVGGSMKAAFRKASSLQLGPLTMTGPLLIELDLSALAPLMGVEIGGVIGHPLLARSVVEISMAQGTIALHDPATYKLGAGAWGELLLPGRHPCVHAAFDGGEGYFTLDTGAAGSAVTMHAPATKRLKLLEGRNTVGAKLGGVGGMVDARAGQLEWFELAGKRFGSTYATFATQPVGAFADPYTVGNIGGKLLAPFTLVLDFAGRRVAFIERAEAK